MHVYLCTNKTRRAFLYWTTEKAPKPVTVRSKSLATVALAVKRPEGRVIRPVAKRIFEIVGERKIPPFVKPEGWEKEWETQLLFECEGSPVEKIMEDLAARATDGWLCLNRRFEARDLAPYLPPEEPLWLYPGCC